ncbi:MAG: carboxypeptidase regulatory-like domain-containing protein [Planctomycetia bacterium]|nr:carboxypeptidase regulatory-like domain-containing protein [Planctomycetia bacterium]
MLIGYVSDQRYVALGDVLLEFESGGRSFEARSRASGSVFADLPPGDYRAVLCKPGYGRKVVERLSVSADMAPYHFRLLEDGLLGYVWPKYVRAGDKGEFRVHAVEQYKLSLWRYGLAKELVQPIGWFDEHGPLATMQITPDGDYTQSGAKWNEQGYTSPHHKQFVTAPERSGLYYFHAQTASAEFSFPWVVAPREPQAQTAVLLANLTWNAYNNFGGRSNYIHPDKLPPRPTVNARQELTRYIDPRHINYQTEDYAPLSLERPEPINHIPLGEKATDPIEGRAACHVAPAEWRLLAWLQRQGFAHDVWCESQLHFDQLPLDRYRVLILPCHPEYWSSKMYFAVKDWVFRRGGRLMYLGGNGINCDVEVLDESTVIYRNTDNTHHKERGVASRFAARHEPEARLLGVMYDERGIMTAAPYRVVDSTHWALAGTGLRKGDVFGKKSLHQRVPGGASGHETDKIGPHSPANVQLLAEGLNPDGGGAHLVAHEPDGGGAVFSTGSICWISSLLADDAVSKITANVLRKFLES